MKTTEKTNINNDLLTKFLVIVIADVKYVIPLIYVREIIEVPEVTKAPRSDEYLQGIITLRDKVISLINTRKRLGALSLYEEFQVLMDKYETMHINTVENLEKLVLSNQESSFQTNPNLCAFGQWINHELYDRNLNKDVRNKIDEIAVVHNETHQLIGLALKLYRGSEIEKAIDVVQKLKNENIPLISALFQELKTEYSKKKYRELSIIIELDNSTCAILTDKVEAIKYFNPQEIQKGSLTNNKMILGIHHDENENIFQEINLIELLGRHK